MIAGETDRAPFRRDSNNLAGRDSREDPYSKTRRETQRMKRYIQEHITNDRKGNVDVNMWIASVRESSGAANSGPPPKSPDGSFVKTQEEEGGGGPIKLLHLHPPQQ